MKASTNLVPPCLFTRRGNEGEGEESDESLLRQLDALGLTVRLARVDLLARLLDGLEHGLVVEARGRDDDGFLLLERHVVALDACVVSPRGDTVSRVRRSSSGKREVEREVDGRTGWMHR